METSLSKELWLFGIPVFLIAIFVFVFTGIFYSPTQTNPAAWIVWAPLGFLGWYAYHKSSDREWDLSIMYFAILALDTIIGALLFLKGAPAHALNLPSLIIFGIGCIAVSVWFFSRPHFGQIVLVATFSCIGLLPLLMVFEYKAGLLRANPGAWGASWGAACFMSMVNLLIVWSHRELESSKPLQFARGAWIRVVPPIVLTLVHLIVTMFAN